MPFVYTPPERCVAGMRIIKLFVFVVIWRDWWSVSFVLCIGACSGSQGSFKLLCGYMYFTLYWAFTCAQKDIDALKSLIEIKLQKKTEKIKCFLKVGWISWWWSNMHIHIDTYFCISFALSWSENTGLSKSCTAFVHVCTWTHVVSVINQAHIKVGFWWIVLPAIVGITP